MPRVVIIGSGIAATIASRIGASLGPIAYSYSPPGGALDNHHAVLRIKDEHTATVLGCQARKVIAHRMALVGGKLTDCSDIRVNNEYSLKVYGELRECSALKLGRVERYLVQQPVQPSHCSFNKQLLSVNSEQRRLIFRDTVSGEIEEVEYEWCISTIPMPVMAKFVGIPTTESFQSRAIGVRKYRVAMNSSVCQTLYVPGREFKTYRMSLHDQVLMVEHSESRDGADPISEEVAHLVQYFGLGEDLMELQGCHNQAFGKIVPVSDRERKRILFQLTDSAKVLSLGRYATWRSIRIEDVMRDAQKVFGIIDIQDEYERLYRLSKEALP